MKSLIFYSSLFVAVFLSIISCSSPDNNNYESLEIGTGYENISGENAIILDPLLAKATVFKHGDNYAAIVECDVALFADSMTIQARKKASVATGIPYEKYNGNGIVKFL